MGVRETNSPLEQRVDKIVNSTEWVEHRNPDNGVRHAEIRGVAQNTFHIENGLYVESNGIPIPRNVFFSGNEIRIFGTAPESRRSILERIVNELSEQRRNLSLQGHTPEQFLDVESMRFLGAYASFSTRRMLNRIAIPDGVSASLFTEDYPPIYRPTFETDMMGMPFHEVHEYYRQNQSINVVFDMEVKPPMLYTGPVSVEYHRDEFFYAAMLGTPTVKQRRLKQRCIREQKQNGGIRSFYFFDHYRKRRSVQ